MTGAVTSISGRVSALAVVPSTCGGGGRCGTIYVGTASGGVWKTTNFGASYVPLMDHQLNLSIGTIVLDPKNANIVYVGTGEGNFSADSNHGIGILKSTDGGTHRTDLGYDSFVNRGLNTIVVDQRWANTANAHIYAGTTSGLAGQDATYGAGGVAPGAPPRGFFYSNNGGQTWTMSNPTGIGNARVTALISDPTDPNTLWMAMASWGVFKSTDDGLHWTPVSTLPVGTGDVNGPFFRISLAMAPSDHQTIYAAYDNNLDPSAARSERMFRTTNGGGAWSALPVPDICSGQCGYDMPLAVDPTDPNTVYQGGQYDYSFEDPNDPLHATCIPAYPMALPCSATIAKSSDGGQTWADVGRNGSNGPVHPDNHIIVIPANDRTAVYDGNDGGFFHSADGSRNAGTVTNSVNMNWDDLNRGLGGVTFTGIAVGPTGAFFAGTQDNGTFRGVNGNTTFTHVNGGDGGFTAVDSKNPNRTYYAYFGPSLVRDDSALQSPYQHDGLNTWIAPFGTDSANFYAPYAVAPSASNNIFYGTDRIWRSKISGGVDGNHDGDATNDPSDTTDWVPISPHWSTIAAVAVAPNDPNTVVVGTSNAAVYITHNALADVTTDSSCDSRTPSGKAAVVTCEFTGGVTWTEIDGNPVAGSASSLPGRYPTSIAFAPNSNGSFYITFSGYSSVTPDAPGHVFYTTDSGNSWTNLNGATAAGSAPLPDLPFNSIVVNTSGGLSNGHLYAAADFGVWVSLNNGKTWQRRDFGLPNTPVYMLGIGLHGNQLYAATHGRGIFYTGAP